MAYEDGIELFRTDPTKLLLAWLRILEADIDRGWTVVLERAGYTLDQIRHVLDREEYPSNMVAFWNELDRFETVSAIAHHVFDRYGFGGPTAEEVCTTIQSVHDTTTLTRGDLIRFIEEGIESGATHEVNAAAGPNAVTVQTVLIHSTAHICKLFVYPDDSSNLDK